MYDAAVIGGGPAGLTAALYLARFRLSVFLADAGNSRTALIPRTHNQPFWPDGISGTDLLERMQSHLAKYPVQFVRAEVAEIRQAEAGFELLVRGSRVHTKAVIVATGVVNRRPRMSPFDHEEALRQGLLRYCPICDGHENTDRTIAVVGEGDRLCGEAKFLRGYTSTVTAFSESGSLGLSKDQRQELTELGIEVIDALIPQYRLRDRALEVRLGPRFRRFESLYAALGSDVRSQLAVAVGAKSTDEGCLVVDEHQRTSVSGLYAAGDVVRGVDQIGHAIGQAVVAATALRNDLCERAPRLR
jgi:thioredoxin reductase (NADPH)